MTSCSSNRIHLYLSHYISCNIHGLEFTSDECKTVLLNRVIEEEAYINLKVLRYTRKRPLYVLNFHYARLKHEVYFILAFT
jgi:hypothetical protein